MKPWLTALLIALLPCVAGAAGFGRLNVLSALGQPFNAEIDLVSVSRDELSTLAARLAFADAYRQANLQYSPALIGARISIEKRANGQPYIKITSSRSVNEPFIDLLIELTWTAGRVTREYTALLDPPGMAPSPPAPAVSKAPVMRPAPAPVAVEPAAPAPIAAEPVAPAPIAAEPVAPSPVIAEPAIVAPMTRAPVAAAPETPRIEPARPITGATEYGPIERGETLGWIALKVLPEGVTLEQMMVGLYRSNPDVFIRKNLNLVRTGKILRVPDREELAAISQPEAVTEYRTHVSDWNTYRQNIADAAGVAPAEGRSAVSGKISTKAEDKVGSGEPKDVVRLSKGEPPGAGADKGKPRSNAERIRMLEEEVVAREKALNDANERITQLEKTINDMQTLLALKSPGMATAQQQAQQQATRPKPEAAPAPKPEAVAIAKPEAARPVETPKPEAAAPADTPVAPQPQLAAPAQPKPKPRPKVATPPPAREPELIEQIIEAAGDPLHLAAGGGVIVLGGLAIWMIRRRRAQADESEPFRSAPTLSRAAAAAAGVAAATPDATAANPTLAAVSGDEVDPMAEAEVYIAYGRDGQAEEILKETLARNPRREDVQLKLLEVYAARKDKTAFGKLASNFSKLTGGAGDNWLKVAAMGFALDPADALYEAGKRMAVTTNGAGQAGGSDVDLDLGQGGPATSTDIMLEAAAAEAAVGADTAVLDPGAFNAMTAQTQKRSTQQMPDFTLDAPVTGAPSSPDIALEATGSARDKDSNVIDFHIELPKVDAHEQPTVASGMASDAGVDFQLDGLNLSLDDRQKGETVAGGDKNGHWYDVQTKFDLAKAYQEMGDRDGAKEILQEVIMEGDAEQKSQAKRLLDHLG